MPVPRWILVAAAALALFWVALRILVPPAWIVQRLDAPSGKRSALLLRTQYVRQSFKVHVRNGWLWHTAYYSPPITNDFRIDLEERLIWSGDSQRVYLEVQGRPVWGHDFDKGRDLSAQELAESGAR